MALGLSRLEQGRELWVASGTSTSRPQGQWVARGTSGPNLSDLEQSRGLWVAFGLSHPKAPGAEGGIGVETPGAGQGVLGDTGGEHPETPLTWSSAGGCGWHRGAGR